jgi:succinoglycan biosynthesis protein ExoM
MRVAVCITTYKRPDGLRRLLSGLNELRFENCMPSLLRVIVVDNDAAGTASAVCENARETFRWPLEYHVEPRRGISQARNQAISCALPDADFMAFVDDDEVPEPLWLDALLRVQQTYDADVVGGPVLPRFIERPPEWIVEGRFFEQRFERPRYPTGYPIDLAATGNVLLRAEVFEGLGKAFDERLGLTGCEDAVFFARVREAGYKMVWADEAQAHEWIPPTRANARWILQRAYSTGNSLSLYERILKPSLGVRAIRLLKGSVRIVQGLSLLPPSLILGRASQMGALQHVCRGAGMLAGLTGSYYQEYK